METAIKSLSEIAFIEAFRIRPAKSFYKFESTNLTEFNSNNIFEWDFENHKTQLLQFKNWKGIL